MALWKPPRTAALVCVSIIALCTHARGAEPPPPTDADLARPVDRPTLVRAALARNPAIAAARQRARATRALSSAEGRLPPPEATLDVWGVPLARPYAVTDAQMTMVGLRQAFPAPGALGAREESRLKEAQADDAMADARGRELARDVDHAFADYAEATRRHEAHASHQDVARRILAVAQARLAAGGALTDVTQADLELARVEADVAGDHAKIGTSRARVNALLARPGEAPLGPALAGEPAGPAWAGDQIAATARGARPELRALSAQRDARAAEQRAMEREASFPMITVGALWFPPLGMQPHGYGVSAMMTLPWLWGAASKRAEGQRAVTEAAQLETNAARVRVDAEALGAHTAAISAVRRLQVLRDRARPAARRALDAAIAAYEAGRGDLPAVLMAERGRVEIEVDHVMARAALDHALADLDFAAGREIPRAPIPPTSPAPPAP